LGGERGSVTEVRSWVQAGGQGQLEAIGNLEECSRGAVRAAVTWLCCHLKTLTTWLPIAASGADGKMPGPADLLWRVRSDCME
jgi:hypothetical protein